MPELDGQFIELALRRCREAEEIFLQIFDVLGQVAAVLAGQALPNDAVLVHAEADLAV